MQRVVHISNRVNIPRPGEATAGGLDEAISSPPEGYDMVRIGWSGKRTAGIEFDPKNDVHDTTVNGVRYITVDLPDKLVTAFYDGDANGFRWAVNHNRVDLSQYSEDNAKATGVVNALMASVVNQHISPTDVLIVHDYHFTEMGSELRKLGVKNPVGHFVHTPTASQAILENLPDQEQQDYIHATLETLYDYDFVGLQAKRDFTNLVPLISGGNVSNSPEFYEVAQARKRNGRLHTLNVGVFPVIGMNELYEQQAKAYEHHPDTRDLLNRMHVPNRKPQGIAWERLDYSKGLPNKFDALSIHLSRIARGDVGYKAGSSTHFAQVASYGRDNTEAYKIEKAKVDQAYNSLRHLWGRVAHMEQKPEPRPVLLGAARQSDYSLVTPLIDGMNLAGIEYVFANRERDNPGVLILSNQTGLAGVLNNAAILVDPMRPRDIANALRDVTNMTPSERRANHDACVEALSFNSNTRWQNELIKATIKGAEGRRGPAPANAPVAAP